MAGIGCVMNARDGIVVATDTFLETPGAANGDIRQLDNHTACYVVTPGAIATLDAYVAATQPLPAGAGAIMVSLVQYATAHPPAAGTAPFEITIVGLSAVGPAVRTVASVAWTGRAVTQIPYPGNLFIGHHSIPRYLADRICKFNVSLDVVIGQAVFCVTESSRTLPNFLRPHVAVATISRDAGLRWVDEPRLQILLDQAVAQARRLSVELIGLF